MSTLHLLRALKSYAVVALLAAGSTLQSPGTMAAKPKPLNAVMSSSPSNFWLIFIDDLHVDFRNTGRLKTLLKTVSAALIHDGDLFAILSSGPSSLSVDLTSDPTLLEDGIAKVSGAALKPSEMLNRAQTAEEPDEVRYRVKIALSTAYNTIVRLEQLHDRRKALIYISNGYNFDPSPNDRGTTGGTNPFLVGGNKFSVAQLRDQLSALTGQAKRANVSIFAIDPRGLAGPSTIDPNVDRRVWQNYWTTTRNSLRVISEQTGGFAILDESELADGLTRINSMMRD